MKSYSSCRLKYIRVAHASRVLAIASSRSRTFAGKDCFGETPKPTRETRALPGTDFVDKLPTNAASSLRSQSRLKTAQTFRAHSRRLDITN